MATKVLYKQNGQIYLLIGVGYGAFRATRPSLFLGNLVPTKEQGQLAMIAVTDDQGVVRWARSEDIEVVEIDGKSPAELLA
jgi:hypothetical protein